MNLSGVSFGCLVLLLIPWQAKCDKTYDIPVAINPLVQDSVTIDSTARLFYNMDKDFFSKVTVADAAKNAEQRIQDTIQKRISVVFLTVASSHVSGTLTLNDLQNTKKSKWSYTVDVESILKAGTLTKVDGETIIYKIQENAMKVLEERFDFQKSEILNRLQMDSMDYYAVDESKWIKVVEIIVEKVIAKRSEILKLTNCYLAEMVGKTVAQLQGFTLNEVNMYLYNTTILLEKLPEYRNNVLSQLYKTFEMTSTDLARISNTSAMVINTMTLNDLLKLFTNSVLNKLRVKAYEVAEKDSSFDPEMLLSCTDKWETFKSIVIPESFDNSAQAMAVEVEVLSNLINISYSELRQLSILKMLNLLEMTIDPLSTDKKLIEATILSNVLALHSADKINISEKDIFEVIYKFTNFTESQLTMLYGWTSKDYQFSKTFTLEDTKNVCKIDFQTYGLLALAKLTAGQVGDISCQSFNVLKKIWERQTVAFLEYEYSSGQQLPLDTPISEMVSHLTQAPQTINYRVLNITSDTEKLISRLSLKNITEVTTYRSEDLKALSFQDVIGIIVHLKHNGSFDHQLVSHFILTSLTPSLMITSIRNNYTTNNNHPTSTNQILHKTSAMHETSTFSYKHMIVLASNSLIRFLSTSQEPKNTITRIPNQANTTISPHQTASSIAAHRLPTTRTSLSQSKIPSILRVNDTASSYNSATIKNTLNETKMINHSNSTIGNFLASYHGSTAISSSQPGESIDKDSYTKISQKVSFLYSTVLRRTTSFLPVQYSRSQSNVVYINPTTTKEHYVEFTLKSNSSAKISPSNVSNILKTVVTISSTETKRIMTEQSLPFSAGIGSNVPVGHTTVRLTPSTIISMTFSAASTKNFVGIPMNTFTPGEYSSYNTQYSNVSQTKYSTPTSTHQSSQSKISLIQTIGNLLFNTTPSQSELSHHTDSSIITEHSRTSLIMLGTEKISAKTESRLISVNKQNQGTTTSDTPTILVTPQNSMSETTSTKVMVNTTKSSAEAVTDPYPSKQYTSTNGNKSSRNMISLVIQTTYTESTKHTNIKSTTAHVTSSLATSFSTTSTKPDTPSMFEASTTMNVLQSTAKISSNIDHHRSTMNAVLKSSSNSYTKTSITAQLFESSTRYISNPVMPSSPNIFHQSKVSAKIFPTDMTSQIKPSTTKVATASSRTQQTAITCQLECKADEICTARSQTPRCKAAQHVEGNMRITSGANFTADLQNKTSEAFEKLASQFIEVIDSVFNHSRFASSYIGAQVLRFEQGSVVVLYKLTFDTSNAISDDMINDVVQLLKNAKNANFIIDSSSITVRDFDECSSRLPTKCDEAATCNNTLGSYSCICRTGMVGDGTSCQVVNSANSESKEEVPWIIYVVIAIMVVLIVFLIVVIIHCEKKHKKKHRPQVLDFHNGRINMYPRSTSYLAQTPESEADLADGLGIVNKHAPQLNMVTFNPTPDDTKELELQKGQPGVFQYRL